MPGSIGWIVGLRRVALATNLRAELISHLRVLLERGNDGRLAPSYQDATPAHTRFGADPLGNSTMPGRYITLLARFGLTLPPEWWFKTQALSVLCPPIGRARAGLRGSDVEVAAPQATVAPSLGRELRSRSARRIDAPCAGDDVMTNEQSALFDRLRSLVFREFGGIEPHFADQPDLVPIEGSWSDDGTYICLHRSGTVGQLDAAGLFDPHATFAVSGTALIASLARRVPLASWFIPKCARPEVCSSCKGTGNVSEAPLPHVVCKCGGLGWVEPSAP